jgi:CBS domain-containing protein
MDSVQYILANKGSHIYTIPATATVLEATRLMNRHKIGALVVLENDHIAGIFSERDVLTRVLAQELSPRDVRVGDAMTRDIVCCGPDTDIEDASSIMRDKRVRHLPVCDEAGNLMGMISIGDLNAYYASAQQAEIRFLHDYVYGRV